MTQNIVIYDPTVTKLKSELRRDEFIRWYWIDVTIYADKETILLRGRERPIEESLEAGKQFDEYLKAYRSTEQTIK